MSKIFLAKFVAVLKSPEECKYKNIHLNRGEKERERKRKRERERERERERDVFPRED